MELFTAMANRDPVVPGERRASGVNEARKHPRRKGGRTSREIENMNQFNGAASRHSLGVKFGPAEIARHRSAAWDGIRVEPVPGNDDTLDFSCFGDVRYPERQAFT